MLLTSRSWLHVSKIRRLYTESLSSLRIIGTRHSQVQLPQFYKGRFRVPIISTLRPEKLVHSDFLVLARRMQISFHTQLSLHSPGKCKGSRQSTRLNYESYTIDSPDNVKHDVESKSVGGIGSEVEIKGDGLKRKKRVHAPFPACAQGFLYLHQPQPGSGLPRLASSIRFRCVPSLVGASSSYVASIKSVRTEPSVFLPSSLTNPEIYEAFKSGYDLTHLNGLPWSIPVLLVAGRPSLEYIRMQLLADGLFRKGELQEYEEIHKNTNLDFVRRMNLLYTLEDVFPVRFDNKVFVVWTAVVKDEVLEGRKGEKASQVVLRPRVELGRSEFGGVFMESWSEHIKKPYIRRDRKSSVKHYEISNRSATKTSRKLPYTGAAHVRFELAPGSKPSNPALCLRIVKITEPVKCVIPGYDGCVHMPKEGELFMRGWAGKSKPWICQLDPFVHKHRAMLNLVPGYKSSTNLC